MITDLKPYPAMKDSGVEWLGEVPEHWEVMPNRALFDEIKERDYPDEQMLSVTIKKGVIQQAALLEGTSKKDSSNLDRSNYKLVQPGDIAYNKMRAWQGAVGVSDYRGIISPAYVVQRPRTGVDSRYFHHLLRTSAFAKEAERWSYGITSDTWSLRPEHFKMIYCCLPSLPEQASILRFLDYVDRRIRRYIRAKQKLIKLLEEQKQAIIHCAVTRGLDPDVHLKPSGVEWLGKVPEHWEVRRIKSLFREVDARTTTGSETLLSLRMYEGLVPHREVSDRPILSSDLIGYKKVKPDQLVMNRMRAAIGIFGVPVQAGLVSPDYAVFDPAVELELAYFLRLFKSKPMCEEFRIASKGLGTGSSGFMRLYSDQFGRVWAPFPPLEEQATIVEHLDEAIADIATAIARAIREIELLAEYRSRLIADVVTGKLDVREPAASLPDESEESDATDDLDELEQADCQDEPDGEIET